jgi:CMP/dCMP kinase
MKKFRIAIDGPAGAGKSTLSKYLAGRLGMIYLDTGAMYRAFALGALREGIDGKDAEKLKVLTDQIKLNIKYNDRDMRIYIDNEDVTEKIRTKEVSLMASDIAVYPFIRLKMVDIQRDIAKKHSVVMDGRDIGSFVLKDADIKIFLTADQDDRAKRRQLELIEKGERPDLDEIRKDIGYRDANDLARKFAPLVKADDAVVFDTSGNTLNESKELLLDYVKEEMQINKYRFKRDVIVFIVKSLLKLFYKIKIKGLENVPKDGALIVCANHTSYIDVPVLECYIDRLITFVAKKELYKVPLVSFVVKAFDSIPVDRDVKDISAAKEAYKRLKRGRCIGIFPEGTRSVHIVKGKKKYRIRTGAVKLACETSSPILPVSIRSTFKPFSVIEMVVGSPEYIVMDEKEDKPGEFFKRESVRLMKEIYNMTGRENEYLDR